MRYEDKDEFARLPLKCTNVDQFENIGGEIDVEKDKNNELKLLLLGIKEGVEDEAVEEEQAQLTMLMRCFEHRMYHQPVKKERDKVWVRKANNRLY